MKKATIGIIVAFIAIFSVFYFEMPVEVLRPVFHKQIINYYSQAYKLDPLFVTAIIKEESKFFHKARSHRGAVGLMQLMPSTAMELAPELGYKNLQEKDLEDPRININIGMYYLSRLDKTFKGDKVLILAAYNAGTKNAIAWKSKKGGDEIEPSDIPFGETKKYVNRVLRTYQWLKETQKIKRLIRGKIT